MKAGRLLLIQIKFHFLCLFFTFFTLKKIDKMSETENIEAPKPLIAINEEKLNSHPSTPNNKSPRIQKPNVPIISVPPKLKTPRGTQNLSNTPLIELNEEENKSMTNLRRSVEGQIQTLMEQKAELKTDPNAADDEDDEDNNQVDDNEENIDLVYHNDGDEKHKDAGTSSLQKDNSDEEKENLNQEEENADENNENEQDVNGENEDHPDTSDLNEDENSNKKNLIDKRLLITQVDEVIEAHNTNIVPTEGFNVNDQSGKMLIPTLELDNDQHEEKVDTNENEIETSKKSSKETTSSVIVFNDEDVVNAFQEYKKSKTIPPLYMRDAIIRHIHDLSAAAIEAEDYDLGEQLDKDLNNLIRAFNLELSKANSVIPSELESRREEVKKQMAEVETEWEQKIKQLKSSEQKKIEELEAKQAQERLEFEARCQAPDFLQKFTKPSSRLLQLWKLQKALALQHDFEGAKEMKAKAEALQKQETIEAQKRAIASVKQNYEMLVIKQQRELDCAVANGKRKVSQMRGEMKKDLENKEKLNKQVEIKMKEWRPPLKKSNLPPLAREIQSPQGRRVGSRSRSRQQEPTVTALDVKITNIRSVLGARPKH